MSNKKKNKGKGGKGREKRQQVRRERTKQKRNARASAEASAESKDSLEGMKRAPPPEVLPGGVLLAGAMLPVIAVRWAPQWPAWGLALTWLGSLVVATLLARSLAKRRAPKWDPILFFGAGGVLALAVWTNDSGAVWVANNRVESVTWSVDGGIETELAARSRARLDLRAGHHVALVGGEAVEFDIGPGDGALISHGEQRCVLIGSRRFEGKQLSLPKGGPEPILCPSNDKTDAGNSAP